MMGVKRVLAALLAALLLGLTGCGSQTDGGLRLYCPANLSAKGSGGGDAFFASGEMARSCLGKWGTGGTGRE